jgi:hypothetical protein
MKPTEPAKSKKTKKAKTSQDSTQPAKSSKPMRSAPPAPRPALSRAPDADVHPVTGRIAPSPEPRTPAGKSFKPVGGGPTTADAIMGAAGDKLVDLGVRVPKSVRKKLRQQAKARGVSVDDLVASILTAALPRD